MTDYTEQEIERLHEKLAGVYRRGPLNAAERLETEGLWARIERLQSASIAAKAKEARYLEKIAAAKAAKEIEEIV